MLSTSLNIWNCWLVSWRMLFPGLLLVSIPRTDCCTNYLVSKGASADGSVHFSYAADSGNLYGTLGYYPAGQHSPGTQRKVYDWDSGVYLGSIPEASETYRVVGNMNEHQLAIGETTFGGRDELKGSGHIDYGSLIWITLQRSKTAREAIHMMGSLVAKYGYASEGESFSIGDPDELWILEMIGKGSWDKGAVWVAQRIPDGHVSGHANQARIRTFNWSDPTNVIYAADVADFARARGWFPKFAPREMFSFSDTYDPLTFSGARLSEARVWNFFRQVAEDSGFGEGYLDYVSGRNLSHRMPLSLKPKYKISINETFTFMRAHYEGTELDMRNDVGAGPHRAAFRIRPLAWKAFEGHYFHERTPGTPQTGWHFVAQLRNWLPREVGGVLWFGVDDASFSVHLPMYSSMLRVPKSLQDGVGDALTFSFDSAFWVFNLVANMVYGRYAVLAPIVLQEVIKKENQLLHKQPQIEADALQQLKLGHVDASAEMLTAYSENVTAHVVNSWLDLWKALFVRFRDGFDISSQGPHAPDHGGKQGGVVPNADEPGYSVEWYSRIALETGNRYRMLDNNTVPDMERRKLQILAGSKGHRTHSPEKPMKMNAGPFSTPVIFF